MSGPRMLSRFAVAIGTLLLLGLTIGAPNLSQALPMPQATTASGSPSPTPSATTSEPDPGDDPTDDGSEPAPDQSGTWIAVGGAFGLAVLAGLIVLLRKQ